MAVEEEFEAGLGFEGVGLRLDEAECGEEGPEGAAPLVVAEVVRMQEVGEFFFLRRRLGVGEERVGVEDR